MRTLRFSLTVAVVLQIFATFSLTAFCKTDQCRSAVSWKHGLTAIVLDAQLPPNRRLAAAKAIEQHGGVIGIEAGQVLIGWFPGGMLAGLRGTNGIRHVSTSTVDLPLLTLDGDGQSAIGFFNRVVSGEYEDRVEAGLKITGEPLTGCVVGSDLSHRAPRTTAASEVAAVTGDGKIRSDFWFRQPWQNPDMRGRVRVNYFKLESSGAIDPNLYTWSYGDSIIADDQIFGAFAFWANEASARSIALTFGVKRYSAGGLYRWQNWVLTPYEPVTRASSQDYLWINSVLSQFGYAASPVTQESVYIQNDNFNAFSKTADATTLPFDRAFTVYLAYNPPPAPAQFADGQRAYAQFDGPYTAVLWNSSGWGPNNLGRVLTHETGHIFWACDEYYDAASNTGCFNCDLCIANTGPRPNLPNGNCDYPSGTCLVPLTTCIMKANDHALCPHTILQIGW